MSAVNREPVLDGWGFAGESFPPPAALWAWLQERLEGPCEPLPRWRPHRFRPPAGRRLPKLPGEVSTEALDRLRHARGRGLTDLVRLRTGTVPALPDAVLRPADVAELSSILAICSQAQVGVVPWGGGTSVTGGVNITAGPQKMISLDLARFRGLLELDDASGLATFGAGTPGPEVERPLAARGLTLGHYPQSWELSTVGGWVATRASGQESLGYGGIESLVAGVDLVAPRGGWSLAPQPASAAGPDLRQLVLGSEGRLGVIHRATLRVSARPQAAEVRAALLPSWSAGIEAVRTLVRARSGLHLLRLSDELETGVGLRVGLAGRRLAAALLRRWLLVRGAGAPGCLLLYGAAGRPRRVRGALAAAASVLRDHRALRLGAGPGRRWLADRFRHPYLRDALLDRGVAVDTLETAAPWSRLEDLTAAVRTALTATAAAWSERCPVLAHVSHPYPDGGSLYFTFFFRCPLDPEQAVERWAELKRAATRALLAAGGTLSHHHGVGAWHAPWLEDEIGRSGRTVLERAAAALDPDGILSPAALLDPTDRLEE